MEEVRVVSSGDWTAPALKGGGHSAAKNAGTLVKQERGPFWSPREEPALLILGITLVISISNFQFSEM